MKKLELEKFISNLKPRFLKKFDYDINDIIGVKGQEKFILYTKKKVIKREKRK
jgi:hypothetical protein